jgi:hypothetical protein
MASKKKIKNQKTISTTDSDSSRKKKLEPMIKMVNRQILADLWTVEKKYFGPSGGGVHEICFSHIYIYIYIKIP